VRTGKRCTAGGLDKGKKPNDGWEKSGCIAKRNLQKNDKEYSHRPKEGESTGGTIKGSLRGDVGPVKYARMKGRMRGDPVNQLPKTRGMHPSALIVTQKKGEKECSLGMGTRKPKLTRGGRVGGKGLKG